jgi:2-amino-4-hydroxy-6-hydroxymethyldihydropteridine diphosphokinase
MVLALETKLSPLELLKEILAIEISLGRKREIKWGARTIDIDILFFNQTIIELPNLVIPHPYLQERRFTLVPLVEIAPTFNHPILKKSITELLAICPDKLEVIKI